MSDLSILIDTLNFAAEKHIYQRRKGSLKIPYINHPVKVCHLLASCGENSLQLLQAALLHDVVEDTPTSTEEIADRFGSQVASIVSEVTDNMSLPGKERKRLQVLKADSLSREARLIKIADKACNMKDLLDYPIWWTKSRKLAYFYWAMEVFQHCKGLNTSLDEHFKNIYERGMHELK
jgi:guanosine-3',5'-bis(diphosphate) 3'-pyrophosphohydrolase